MAEYIEREAVEKYIENGLNNKNKDKAFGHDAIEIMAEVHYMSAADVAPVRHGRWTPLRINGHEMGVTCSECNTTWDAESDFCPNCGAKMDGGDGNSAMA